MQALLPLLFVIPLWFLLIRPQQRRVRAQQSIIRSLAVGDDVLTSAGIYGSIVDLDDEVATLEVAAGVRLRIARMAIARRLNAEVGDAGTRTQPRPPPNGDEPRGPLPSPPADER